MSADGATGRHGRDDDVVVRKADRGWVVGGENVSDLTSAIVLADLFAADLSANDDTAVLEAVDPNDGSRLERPRALGAPSAPTDRSTPRRGTTRRGSETGGAVRQAGMRRGPRETTERRPTRRHASR